MKHLKHIANWTIWTLVGLYVLLLILVHLPSVQARLGSKVADVLSRKLGTEVSIGRIDVGFLNRLIIDDVLISDTAGCDLLKAGRLTARIELLPLLDGRVAISSAQVFGAHVSVYRTDSLSPMNCQFVFDALSSADSTSQSSLDLRINSLIIRHSSVSYDRRDAPPTPGIINPDHIDVSDISAHIVLRALRPDSLNINIKRLAFREQSGLNVQRLALRLEGNDESAHLSDFVLLLPESNLSTASVVAKYRFNDPKVPLFIEQSTASLQLSLPDLAFLNPSLANFDTPLNTNFTFGGSSDDFSVPQLSIHSDDRQLQFESTLRLARRDSSFVWSAQNYRLHAANELIAKIRRTFPEVPELLTRLGDVRLTGNANVLPSGEIVSDNDLTTGIGRLNALLTLRQNGEHISGHLDTDSLHIGRLFSLDQLGMLTTAVDINGTPQDINAKGIIRRIDFKGYPYHDIELDANYKNGDLAGHLKIDDANIATDIEGEWRQGKRSAVRLTGIISHFAPAALHLSDRWGDARFSAVVDADFTASSLNDAEGTIDLDDFTMVHTDSASAAYHLDNLHVRSGYDDGKHFMRLNGDMGEAELKGQFDWGTLPQSFIAYIASKLPTLPGLPAVTKAVDNNFEANIRLNDSEWVEKLLGIPLRLNRPLMLLANVNDVTNDINIKAQIPDLTYNGSRYTDGTISITTEGDTTHCDARLAQLQDNRRRLDLHLTAQASDNELLTSLRFDNGRLKGQPDEAINGVVNAITQLYTNDNGKSEAHVRVQPSRVNIRGTEWELEPSDILYSDRRLMVDQFNLRHDEQHLIVDGIASTLKTDSLMIDLNDIEVAYVLDLINFHAVDFGGRATGKAYITEAFKEFNAWADLEVSQFTFMEGNMGTLVARAEWSPDDNQVELDAFADDGPEAQTFIEGYIAPARDDINLLIRARGTNIDFANSFTDSFLNNVSGQANGDVELIGPLSGVNLVGALAIDGRATVTALNTTYNLQGDSIRFVPNDVKFTAHRIFDDGGHVGYITGALHHSNFTNFTFDLDIEAERLKVYDFPSFGESIICGNVWATGHADLHGRPGEIVINCNVTPDRGSTFSYNAANPDAISNQQFITWHDKEPDEEGEANGVYGAFEAYEPAEAYGSDIRINFIINTTPEATLRLLMDQQTGDYITLNGSGTLSASFYNKGPFQMFGTYNVERGTYGITIQNIIRKNFNFQDGGTITFGGDPFDANLNLSAVYTVNGVSLSDLNIGNSFTNNTVRVNCLMNIQGTAGAPRVEFDLELPTVNSEEEQMIRSIIASEQELNQQVVYLLGIGRFYTQGTNNAGTQQYGQTELAMQSFLSGTVSTQINEVLSQVIKNDDWNFGANISTGNEGWHNAEYEGLVSGRMLNNRLLINGQFGYRDNATQATPSFIGDFDIRYLLLPNGNLALKVYNQSNDRYFTRSSLNTQGVGLIMKKDFNGLRDLFVHRRKQSNNTP